MRRFAKRRLFGIFILLLACSGTWLFFSLLEVSLRSVSLWSGWLLLALMLWLTLFNGRKRVPILALGSATGWMEIHSYVGLYSVFVFLAHLGFELPNSALENVLALFFLLVSASGVVGLALSRLLPRRLAATGETILFERIPAARLKLHEEVKSLVLEAADESETTVLGDLYTDKLADFFHKPRNQRLHLLDSKLPQRNLEDAISEFTRYASAREREVLSEIGEKMRAKNALDFQHAQQLALKGWLFVHIPLTYGLLVAVVAHVILIYAFRGGAP